MVYGGRPSRGCRTCRTRRIKVRLQPCRPLLAGLSLMSTRTLPPSLALDRSSSTSDSSVMRVSRHASNAQSQEGSAAGIDPSSRLSTAIRQSLRCAVCAGPSTRSSFRPRRLLSFLMSDLSCPWSGLLPENGLRNLPSSCCKEKLQAHHRLPSHSLSFSVPYVFLLPTSSLYPRRKAHRTASWNTYSLSSTRPPPIAP
jgi:hypothetical protein